MNPPPPTHPLALMPFAPPPLRVQIYDFGDQVVKNTVCIGFSDPASQGCFQELGGGGWVRGTAWAWWAAVGLPLPL